HTRFDCDWSSDVCSSDLLSPATTQSYQPLAPDSPGPAQLRAALAKYGLVDGTNIRIEMRLAEGKIERLPALARELVESGATILRSEERRVGKEWRWRVGW